MATNRQRYVTSYPEDKLFLVSVTDLRTMREEDFVATAVRHATPLSQAATEPARPVPRLG